MEIVWNVAEKYDSSYNFLLDKYTNIVIQLLCNRKIKPESCEAFLCSEYNRDLHDPFLFNKMDETVDLILDYISKDKKICVFGDYDTDGVCSSFLLVSFLKEIGGDVFCYIPDKKLEGNGMNIKAIDYIKSNGAELIITVDTGVVAFNETDYAKSFGVEVVITDHHEQIPGKLPNAFSVINPKIESQKYPFRELAGVGVSFKLCFAIALKHERKDELLNWLKWNLDCVCVATIADMVSLVDENRVIVKYGLIVLNQTRNLGFKELIKISLGEEKREISVVDIGFKISPRINAAGRMDHANSAYELLSSKDIDEVKRISFELNSKNSDRQNIVSSAVKNFIKENGESINNKKIIIAHHDKWPVGVLGLIATKIRDFYNLPTFAFSTDDNGMVGSGRSIGGFDITKAMQNNPDLFLKFGGHMVACGCTVPFEKYNDFVSRMSSYADENIDLDNLKKDLDIDYNLELSNINLDLYNELKKFEPFGKDNCEPIFCTKEVEVISFGVFGKNSDHFKMNVRKGDGAFTVISFSNQELFDKVKVGQKIDLAYTIQLNEWNGTKELRLMYVDHK